MFPSQSLHLICTFAVVDQCIERRPRAVAQIRLIRFKRENGGKEILFDTFDSLNNQEKMGVGEIGSTSKMCCWNVRPKK